MLLLHYDACATVINGSAHIPKDVTQDPEIRSMLEGESCISRLSTTAHRVDLITVSPCVFAHTIAWCMIVEIWAFIFLMDTSGGENRREETGGETSGSCTRRRPFNFEPAGSCYTI